MFVLIHSSLVLQLTTWILYHLVSQITTYTVTRHLDVALPWQIGKNYLVVRLIPVIVDERSLLLFLQFLYGKTLSTEGSLVIDSRHPCHCDELFFLGLTYMQIGCPYCTTRVRNKLFVVI